MRKKKKEPTAETRAPSIDEQVRECARRSVGSRFDMADEVRDVVEEAIREFFKLGVRTEELGAEDVLECLAEERGFVRWWESLDVIKRETLLERIQGKLDGGEGSASQRE